MITITGPGWAVALVVLTLNALAMYGIWASVVSPALKWLERRMIRNFAAKWDISEDRAAYIWRTVKRQKRRTIRRIQGERETLREKAKEDAA